MSQTPQPEVRSRLQQAVLVGNSAHQVKFSELTIDMFRLMQALEDTVRLPSATSRSPPTPQSSRTSPGDHSQDYAELGFAAGMQEPIAHAGGALRRESSLFVLPHGMDRRGQEAATQSSEVPPLPPFVFPVPALPLQRLQGLLTYSIHRLLARLPEVRSALLWLIF